VLNSANGAAPRQRLDRRRELFPIAHGPDPVLPRWPRRTSKGLKGADLVVTVSSCWQEGDASVRPYNTPDKQVATAFMLYALKRQMNGDVPGATEATITVTGADGRTLGHLRVDADDATRLTNAITTQIDTDFGPMERADVERMMAEHRTNPRPPRH
jgi:hypothetical protein